MKTQTDFRYKKNTPVKCEVDNKNEITTQDFLEKTQVKS